MNHGGEDIFVMQQVAPGNLAGVHDYCDRWCDRCAFANRCILNVSQSGPTRPAHADPLLDHLRQRFHEITTIAARRSTLGIDELVKSLPDPDAENESEYAKEETKREHRRKTDPILREAKWYSGLVHAWFEAETEGVREHGNALVLRAQAEDAGETSLTELARVLDAVAIVRNDAFLICVKLQRAIDGLEEDREARCDDPVQNDYNGSAKVALTCIDRSEGAWRAIDQWYPSCGGALTLAEALAELRMAVEQRLPYARAFLRPGFDALITRA
jgi:hypothetical protein